MLEEKRPSKQPHNLILEDRKFLSLSGVREVGNFDETTVTLLTEMGELTIRGEGLHISKLNLETGELTVDGESVAALFYNDAPEKKSIRGLFAKVFKSRWN